MGLEAATYISQLVATNPVGATDPRSQGDDHLRLIKSVLLATLPALTGAVTATQGELNQLHGSVITSVSGGSQSAPSYSFSGDSNTGIFNAAADQIGLTTGGLNRVLVTTNGMQLVNGSVLLAASVKDSTNFDFLGSSGTNALLAQGSGWTQTRIHAGGAATIIATPSQAWFTDGLVGTPGISFSNDNDTGFYRVTTNAFAAVANGARSAVFTQGVVSLQDGSLTTPGLNFDNDSNTGLYRSGADTINLVAGGVAVFTGDSGNVHLGNSSGYILDLGAIGQSNSATAGAATALPANPTFYASIAFNGVIKKVPVYNL